MMNVLLTSGQHDAVPGAVAGYASPAPEEKLAAAFSAWAMHTWPDGQSGVLKDAPHAEAGEGGDDEEHWLLDTAGTGKADTVLLNRWVPTVVNAPPTPSAKGANATQ